jgi:hypothetical protein
VRHALGCGLATLVVSLILHAAPAAAVCGDGIFDPGEQCEVGPNGDAACQEACIPATLPDGCQCAVPPLDPAGYVVLAQTKAKFGPNLRVTSGDVGATAISGLVAVAPFGQVTASGSVVGDRVRVLDATHVGRLYANSAVIAPGAAADNGGPFRFSVPLALGPPLPALPMGSPGGTPVSVPDGGSQTLAPGSYTDVFVGRDATLILQGLSPGSGSGRYDVQTLTIAFDAHLQAANPVDVRVADRLAFLPTSTVGPAPTATTVLAGDVRFSVAGPTVRITHATIVRAHVRGARKIGVGRDAMFTGQLIAPSVKTAAHVQLGFEGGCGDGRLDPAEQCDTSAPGGDAACPGLCGAPDTATQCTCS